MGDTGPCDLIKIVFGYHVNSQHIILNIKFGANRTFHVPKIPVYGFNYYGRYRTLCTDEDNFWQCYLEVTYNPKYHLVRIGLSMYPRSRYTGFVYMGGSRSCGPIQPILRTALWLIEANLESSQLFAFGCNRHYYGRTERQTQLKCLRISNVSKEPSISDQYFYALHTY